MALTGGVSVLSLMELLLTFLRALLRLKSNSTKEVSNIEPKNVFFVFSGNLYHLKNDFKDFIKMSSIHGVHNLMGSFKEKLFWLTIISISTASCVHFIRELIEAFPQGQVGLELDDKLWNVNEVFCCYFVEFFKVFVKFLTDSIPSFVLLS